MGKEITKLSSILHVIMNNNKFSGWAESLKSILEEHLPGKDYEEVEVIRKRMVDEEQKIAKGEERTVARYISTRDIDRDKEILVPGGCIHSDFNAGTRIPVLFCHNYTWQLGSDDWIKIDKKGVKVKSRYVIPDSSIGSDEAGRVNYVWDMITQGHINTSSVGFIALEWKNADDEGYEDLVKDLKAEWGVPMKHFKGVRRIFTKWILLEHSDVPVPSNIHAINIAVSKGFAMPSECKEAVENISEALKNIIAGEIPASMENIMQSIDEEGEAEKVMEALKGKISIYELKRLEQIAKGVIPYKNFGIAPEDTAWSGPAAIRESDVKTLRKICTWFDNENPDVKGSYKLPHHQPGGRNVAVWRGVAASMAALLGARGGVDVPEADKPGIHTHLSRHYAQFDKEPPELREYTDAELKGLFDNKNEAPYGYCPECGGKGELRERRPNGNDICVNKHTYPSKDALEKPRQKSNIKIVKEVSKPAIIKQESDIKTVSTGIKVIKEAPRMNIDKDFIANTVRETIETLQGKL